MKNETFKTFMAIMSAVVTVTSALVAWRASAASQAAGDADFSGLVATVNAGEARTLNTITATEHYQAFLIYTRYNELGNKLYEALQSDPANAAELEQQKSDSWGIAYGLQSLFFPSQYLRPDGTYDLQRELDEAWADAQRSRDTRSDLHYADADARRDQSNLLVGMLVLMGLAFWFFTLAQIIEHKVKYVFAVVGGFLLVVGAFAALVIELWV